MKTKRNRYPRLFVVHRHLLLVIGVFISLATLGTLPSLLSTAASSLPSGPPPTVSRSGVGGDAVSGSRSVANSANLIHDYLSAEKANPFSFALEESITTFAADCTTPKSAFTLGETVCAKTDGVDLQAGRLVNWIIDANVAHGGVGITDIDSNPQTFTYVPTTTGTWKVTIAEPNDISDTPATFMVDPPPPLATYAGDCTTPKTLFNYGDMVCAKVSGIGASLKRRVGWVDPGGYIRQNNGNLFTDITTDPQTELFQLPSTDTSTIDVFTSENRGSWRVNIVSNSGSAMVSAPFILQGPAPRADLSVTQGLAGGGSNPGAPITYVVTITNQGPNAATSVALTNATPVNGTFQSVNQTTGATFSCTGTDPVVCTITSLPAGGSASFELTYLTGAGGSTLATTSSVTTTTPELDVANNGAVAPSIVVDGGGGGPACTLTCPDTIVVSATTTQGQTRGALVDFASEPTGTCGAVTSTPASGSFFPVGTTSVSSSSAEGGGACSFNVVVVESGAPTIECPVGQMVEADPSATEADVSPGTASASGNNVSVVGVRSDNRPLSDPYPVGTTTIAWTATDLENRTASCTQTIAVTVSTAGPAPTIECPANVSENADQGQCQKTVNLGLPTSTGTGVTTSGERSDGLALSAPYPSGTTIVTWTATDSLNRSVSCSQTVIVNAVDETAPTVTAPSNRTFFTDSCSRIIILNDELGSPNAADNCSGVSITTSGMPAGNEFPVGTTTLTFTATDAAGNTSAPATQLITVKESPAVPPTITAPANVTVNSDNGSCSATGVNLGTPTTADNCGVASVTNNAPASFPVGSTTVRWTVADASGNTATADQIVTVVDNENPTITAPADKTFYTGANASSCSVTVTDGELGAAQAADNCPGVTWARSGGNVFSLGETTVTYTATDAHGRTATATQKVTVVDNTAPVVIPPANITVYLPLNSTATSMAVSYPNPATATDNCGVPITFSYSPVSGSTFPTGPTTVTVTATDANSNSASATFTVTVLYNFTGFSSPVANLPTVNNVNAGRSIPLKFSLSGNKGLDIFAAGYPASQQVACNSSDLLSELEGLETPGGSTLNYSPDQYHYNWKTEQSWAGTCRQLVVTLNDGSTRTAMFKFK